MFKPHMMNTALRISTLLAAAFLFAACDVVEPVASSGFDAERLLRIDAAMEREVEAGELPGAVALVMKNGEIVYHKSFGFADIASQSPMQNDSIFRIASMTKAITSVAVMTLYEQGYFQLNDPVADYLPEFADMHIISEVDDAGNITATTPATQPIRVVDLLTHSAGIGYPFIPSKVQKSYLDAGIIDGLTANNIVLKSQMALLATQPLLFEPGSAFTYGLNTDVLGYFVEVVSGMSLAQYFEKAILAPLGMHDTAFYLPADKKDRLVTLYAWEEESGLVVSRGEESSIIIADPLYPVTGAKTYYSGGGGLSSTAYDYARFLQMLLNNGELDGVRILSRKSVELMRTARIDWNDDGEPDFGLGFGVNSDIGKAGELSSAGNYAWGGAFNTSYWIDPEEDLLGVFMSQARPAKSRLRERFSTLVYQALE